MLCTHVPTGVVGVAGACAVVLAVLDNDKEPENVKVVPQELVVVLMLMSTLKLMVN